jgi:hypothetical protein
MLCLVSSVFLLLVIHHAVQVLMEAGHNVLDHRNWVTRPFTWGLVFIFRGHMCSLFATGVVFEALVCFGDCFNFLCWLWVSLWTSFYSICPTAVPAVLHCCIRALLICWGREAACDPMIKSQSFSGSLSLGCDLHKCLLDYPSPCTGGRLEELKLSNCWSTKS